MKIIKVYKDVLVDTPKRMTDDAVGFDLASAETITLYPGEIRKILTGLRFAVPVGCAMMICTRSSTFMRGLHIGTGIIDPDYRGPVSIMTANISSYSISIARGDRIAQAIFIRVESSDLQVEVVDSLEDLGATVRGGGGFGSTGK